MAEFENPQDLVNAARQARAAGYRKMDAYTPFPVEGLADALQLGSTQVPLIVLIGGIIGAVAGYGMQYYISAVDYPLNIGGRPFNSWPQFVPVMFETTVMGAALTAGGPFTLNYVLPMRYRFSINGLPEGFYVRAARYGDVDVLVDEPRDETEAPRVPHLNVAQSREVLQPGPDAENPLTRDEDVHSAERLRSEHIGSSDEDQARGAVGHAALPSIPLADGPHAAVSSLALMSLANPSALCLAFARITAKPMEASFPYMGISILYATRVAVGPSDSGGSVVMVLTRSLRRPSWPSATETRRRGSSISVTETFMRNDTARNDTFAVAATR